MSAAEREALQLAQAAPGDIPEILRSMSGCAGAPHWSADALKRLIEGGADDGRRTALFTLRNTQDALCGWVTGACVGEVAELEFLLVEPGLRGMGLGKRLIEHWMGWAAESGATEALLEVRASNTAALQLYGGVGFKILGKRRAYYSDPVEDAVLMSAPLQTPR